MGDGCLLFWNQQRQRQLQEENARRRMYTKIEAPSIGDILNVRTCGTAKTLVCAKKGIIACLAPGDRLFVYPHQARFARAWEIPMTGVIATFGHCDTHRDLLIPEKGKPIPVTQLNRKVGIRVLLLVPRTVSEPTYDENAVQQTLDQLETTQELVPA